MDMCLRVRVSARLRVCMSPYHSRARGNFCRNASLFETIDLGGGGVVRGSEEKKSP